MDLLETVLLILLVADALALAVLVLLQQSRGADIGAAFGSGSANTIFGASGATSFLVKVTATLAIGFFVIAFGLAYTAKERAADLRGFDFSSADDTSEVSSQDVGAGDDLPAVVEGDDLPVFDDDTIDVPSVDFGSEEPSGDIPDL